MNTQLGSKYPIVAMAMNKVSNVGLAVAVHNAGGVGSLSVFNYYTGPGKISDAWFKDAISRFVQETNSRRLLISVGAAELLDDKVFDVIRQFKIELIEYIPFENNEFPSWEYKNELSLSRVKQLQQDGALVFVKTLAFDATPITFDGIILKGPNGAGRVGNPADTLEEMFDKYRQHFPTLKIIPSGGIGTAEQVKYFVDKGAYAVGIGTMLTVANECLLCETTKQRIVESTKSDLTQLKSGARQNAIILSEVNNDNYNNSKGLHFGVTDGTKGHIFSGLGVEHINAIRPAKEIIDDLVKSL